MNTSKMTYSSTSKRPIFRSDTFWNRLELKHKKHKYDMFAQSRVPEQH